MLVAGSYTVKAVQTQVMLQGPAGREIWLVVDLRVGTNDMSTTKEGDTRISLVMSRSIARHMLHMMLQRLSESRESFHVGSPRM